MNQQQQFDLAQSRKAFMMNTQKAVESIRNKFAERAAEVEVENFQEELDEVFSAYKKRESGGQHITPNPIRKQEQEKHQQNVLSSKVAKSHRTSPTELRSVIRQMQRRSSSAPSHQRNVSPPPMEKYPRRTASRESRPRDKTQLAERRNAILERRKKAEDGGGGVSWERSLRGGGGFPPKPAAKKGRPQQQVYQRRRTNSGSGRRQQFTAVGVPPQHPRSTKDLNYRHSTPVTRSESYTEGDTQAAHQVQSGLSPLNEQQEPEPEPEQISSPLRDAGLSEPFSISPQRCLSEPEVIPYTDSVPAAIPWPYPWPHKSVVSSGSQATHSLPSTLLGKLSYNNITRDGKNSIKYDVTRQSHSPEKIVESFPHLYSSATLGTGFSSPSLSPCYRSHGKSESVTPPTLKAVPSVYRSALSSLNPSKMNIINNVNSDPVSVSTAAVTKAISYPSKSNLFTSGLYGPGVRPANPEQVLIQPVASMTAVYPERCSDVMLNQQSAPSQSDMRSIYSPPTPPPSEDKKVQKLMDRIQLLRSYLPQQPRVTIRQN